MRSLRLFLLGATLIAGPLSFARADWQWTRQVISGVGTIRTVAFGNGIYVAGTSTGYLLSSRDAATWTITRPATRAINDVTFGGRRFVALVDGTTGAGARVLYSTDGAGWTTASRVTNRGVFLGKYDLGDVASIGGRFLAMGGGSAAYATSVNGTRWQYPLNGAKPRNYIGSETGLTTSGNRYLLGSAFAGATIQSSKDGTAWTTEFSGTSRGPARGIAAQRPGRRVICVGENGLCLTSSNGGDSWRSDPLGSADLLDVAWNGSLFTACAQKDVYSTPAGVTWTRQLHITRSSDQLVSVGGGGGRYLAVGRTGRNGLIYVSTAVPAP